MLHTLPRIETQIVVTAGSNDSLVWEETDGSSPVTISQTILSGQYYATELLEQIATIMTASSAFGVSYDVAWSNAKARISAASLGTATGWRPNIDQNFHVLTGGAIYVGDEGDEGLGWQKESSAPPFGVSFTAVSRCRAVFFPSYPPNRKDFSFSVLENSARNAAGSFFSISFSPLAAREELEVGFTFEPLSGMEAARDVWKRVVTGRNLLIQWDKDDPSTQEYFDLLSRAEFKPKRLEGYPRFEWSWELNKWQ